MTVSALPDSSSRRRLLVVCLCIVLVGFGMVIANLYKIQLKEGDFYQQRAIAQQLRTTPITANRAPSTTATARPWQYPPPFGPSCFPTTILQMNRPSFLPTA